MTALATIVRAEVAAHQRDLTADAAHRASLRAEERRTEAAAEWANLLEMASRPGRRVSVALVRRLGRAAGMSPADVALVAAAIGAVS